MEYVFGTKETTEILKTKGDRHTDLTGFHEIKREYPDQVITDRFCIVKKFFSADDEEGNCYDWYEIGNHNRFIDKTVPIQEALDVTEVGLMELAEIISSHEEAIAELAELVAGGMQ